MDYAKIKQSQLQAVYRNIRMDGLNVTQKFDIIGNSLRYGIQFFYVKNMKTQYIM